MTITLGPLAAQSATALALHHLDGAAGFAGAIVAEAEGNPFFIRELARATLERSQPLSLAELLDERFAALGADARALLEVVAVAGVPVAREPALRAAGLTGADDAAIPLLRARSLLRGTGERLEIYHPRIREHIVASLPSERRRAIEDALA